MSKVLCIYHGNCLDGFGAAWAVREFFKDSDDELVFYAGHYGKPPPQVDKFTDVVIVDFSYKLDALQSLARNAKSVLILDHHKSAAEDLTNLPASPINYIDWKHELDRRPAGYLATTFDMNRSGAGLTWDFFHWAEGRPRVINHIEDRDLWRFNLPYTKEINAAMFSYPYNFELFTELVYEADNDQGLSLTIEGIAILRKQQKDLDELLPLVRRRAIIGGYNVPCANLPYFYASEGGNTLAQGEPFAATYYDRPDGRFFSLRSTPTGVDVSMIAKAFGGGGHRNAAGFSVPWGNPAMPEFVE